MTDTETIDKILKIAEDGADVRPDGTRATLGTLYAAMIKWAEVDFQNRIDRAIDKKLLSIARKLCVEDHRESWNRPVLYPGTPPMIYRIPTAWPQQNESATTCVDIGSLLGSGPHPLWTHYIETTRRIMDAIRK